MDTAAVDSAADLSQTLASAYEAWCSDPPTPAQITYAQLCAALKLLEHHGAVVTLTQRPEWQDEAALDCVVPQHLWLDVLVESTAAAVPELPRMVLDVERELMISALPFTHVRHHADQATSDSAQLAHWIVGQQEKTVEKEQPSVPEEPSLPPKQSGGFLLDAPYIKIPGKLSMIGNIRAESGMVKVTLLDGSEQIWAPGECATNIKACEDMLYSMVEAERRGAKVPESAKKSVMDLIGRVTSAVLQARHQMESAGRYDKRTKLVKKTLTRIDQQNGVTPGWDDSVLPDKDNIDYYSTKFEYLKDFEIIAMLRATDMPMHLRVKAMAFMNGKRMAEELNLTVEGLEQMMRDGTLADALAKAKVKA